MRVMTLLLVVLGLSTVWAADVEIDPAFVLNSNSANPLITDRYQAIGSDGRGTWITVWETVNHAADVNDMSVSRSIDRGQSWSNRQIIESIDTSIGDSFGNPGVTCDGLGVCVVIYLGDIGPSLGLRVARSIDFGVTWSTPQFFTSGIAFRPRIATDGQGNWIVVWWYFNDGDEDIFYTRSTDGGQNWSAPATLNAAAAVDDTPPFQDRRPEVAAAPDGTFVVVWINDDADPFFSTGVVRTIRSLDGGATWIGDQAVWTGPFPIRPDLATDGNGTWVALWDEDGENGLFSRSANNGANWSSAATINSNADSGFFDLTIGADNRGNWLAAWDFPNTSNTDIAYTVSTDGGLSWSAEEVYNLPTPDTYSDSGPQMVLDPNGKGNVIWGSSQACCLSDVRTAPFNFPVIEARDPNPSLLSSGAVSSDPVVLGLSTAREVTGLAADGVTRVVLRREVPGPGDVTFAIEDDTGDPLTAGGLSSPGGSENMSSLLVPATDVGGGQWVASVILRAPVAFVRLTEPTDLDARTRTIRVTAEFDDGGGPPSMIERELELHRPPVALLHGLWSDRGTWRYSWVDRMTTPCPLREDPRFVLYTGDYRQSHALPYVVNRVRPAITIRRAVEDLRAANVAATQADLIGHSMGGVLTRRYAGDVDVSFYRNNNFMEGDLHKLITLDSPHVGSPLADVLIVAGLLPRVGRPIRDAARAAGKCIDCGAVFDLQVNSSETSNMPATSGAAHALVGVGGSDIFDLGLEAILSATDVFLFELLQFHGLAPFPPALQHDIIVGRVSQEGGLAATHTTIFGYDPPDTGIHSDVTKEENCSDRAGDLILELLNTPADDPMTFAPGFPANSALRSTPEAPPIPTVVAGGGTGGLSITQPSPGGSVLPGEMVTVTVEGSGGFVPDRVLVMLNDEARTLNTPPFTTTIAVPVNAASVRISAMAYDTLDNFESADPVELSIDLSGVTLIGISALPDTLYLFPPAPSQAIIVVGQYDDGVDRELSTDPLTGYIAEDPAVASVDSGGVATAEAIGMTSIEVSHGGFQASVDVSVIDLPLQLTVGDTSLDWPQTADTSGYDVVRGDLALLQSTAGDFSQATLECLEDDLDDTTVAFATNPAAGEGWWFLVRPVFAGGAGTWDAVDWALTGQAAPRDAAVQAAPGSCP